MNKHISKLIYVFLILLPLLTFGQQGVLDKNIPLQTGEYSSIVLVDSIETISKSKLSFASKDLIHEKVIIKKEDPNIKEVLELLFDAERLDFLVRKKKILVVPKRKDKSNNPIITISGYVEDLQSRERLIGANIYIKGSHIGTVSNSFGFYSLSVPFTDSLLIISDLIGYDASWFKPSKALSTSHVFTLSTANQQLAEATVSAKESEVLQTQMSNIKINPDNLKKLPSFFGEVDVIKAVQFLPGVQQASEGSINYIVRGGNPDQNLILLDGVPVYNASHIFGFFSVFNPDAVKNIELTKGGFPAHFGGRLSSVLEVDMKEGNMKEFHGSGSIGFIAGKFGLEGPIVKDKTSFMISGRRSYMDLFFRDVVDANQTAGYYFADINVKLNHKFSRKDRLYLSFYQGSDKGFTKSDENSSLNEGSLEWGNHTGALRWNHLFSEKMFGNLTATYSRFNLQIASAYSFDSLSSDLRYFSRIEDYGLKYDLDYILSPKHTFKAGVSHTYHNIRPGALVINETVNTVNIDSLVDLSPATFAHDFFAYAEDVWTVNERLKVNTGLHFSAYLVNSKTYYSLQPRISARYILTENWALKASFASMQQYIHLLTNSNVGLPTDLWVSSTDNIPPQLSHQIAFGSTSFFKDQKWEFTAEAFYKDLSGLLTYRPSASFAPAVNWESQVISGGTGRAYGIETIFRINGEKTNGWLAYTLSKSEREFGEIDEGRTFPYKYDRRHDFKIVFSHDFTKKFNLGATWIYTSGIKATIPVSTYNDLNGGLVVKYSDRNAFTYPSYHRLDIALTWTKHTSWGERSWGVSIFNAYNRKNPFLIYFSTSNIDRSAYQLSLLQIIPSVNYSFRF